MRFPSNRPDFCCAFRWYTILVLFIVFVVLPTNAFEWELGGRFGFETSAFGFDDPYAFSLPVGLYAEATLFDGLLNAGLTFSRVFFRSRSELFSDSFMFTPGLYVGYPVFRLDDDSIRVRVEPYFEYRNYRREHQFLESTFITQRPLTALGIGVAATRRTGVSTGAAVEYQAIWDVRLFHRAAVLLRIGYRSITGTEGVDGE